MTSFLTNDLARYLPRHAIPLYVEEVASGAHPALKFHGHTFMELVLVLSGRGNHLVRMNRKSEPSGEDEGSAGECTAEIHAGDVLLIHPGNFPLLRPNRNSRFSQPCLRSP